MIKNLKYRLGEFLTSRRVRIGGIAIILAFTVAAVTLHGCPIHTADILESQKFFTLNKAFYSTGNTVTKYEEVTFPDSMGNEFFALPDNSYFFQDEQGLLLCGKAFRLKEGIMEQLTDDEDVLDMALLD